jgi:hypothetical protein
MAELKDLEQLRHTREVVERTRASMVTKGGEVKEMLKHDALSYVQELSVSRTAALNAEGFALVLASGLIVVQNAMLGN